MKRRSLRLRLCIFFGVFLLGAWCLAAFSVWKECSETVNAFFDTQQTLFAKRLADYSLPADPRGARHSMNELIAGNGWEPGEFDDDALSFAIFAKDSTLLFSDGDKGERFIFQPDHTGFVNTQILNNDERWRILWTDSRDGTVRVAVGQELEYRRDTVFAMLSKQLAPWVFLVPALMVGMVVLLTIELAPLRRLAKELVSRSPDDSSHLEKGKLPTEVLPLVDALSALFQRTSDMMQRERNFISLSAHELRTPLTAMRIQAEVARLSDISPAAREAALRKLMLGIDHATKMLEQLLALSRVDSMSADSALTRVPVDWVALVRNVEHEFKVQAAKRGIAFSFTVESAPPLRHGNSDLIALLLRNLFDNAVRYTPESGNIQICLSRSALCVKNSGQSIKAEYVKQLGERFFRPPGQKERGSGLGLSIVRQIAQLHGFRCCFGNARDGQDGFQAFIFF